MAGQLAGKTIVVTGGTGNLGRAVVQALGAAGAICHVPCHGAYHGAAPGNGAAVHYVAGVDLADEEAVDRFYAGVPALWASVHLAGGFSMAPITETSGADLRHMLRVNVLTTFHCCRAAVRRMRQEQAGGRIVNVAARPGLEPRRGAGMLAYATAKAAVLALTEGLAEEVKEERILVNAIVPSTFDSPAMRAEAPAADPSRWLAPAAAAATILHLVSPENRELSGALLPLYARA